MAQWTNVNQNNRFVNPCPLPWLSEISGAVHLVSLGLTAGGRRIAGKFQKIENSLQIETFVFSLRLTKVQHHYSSTNAFQALFSGKIFCKVIFKVRKFAKPYDFLSIPTIKYYRT